LPLVVLTVFFGTVGTSYLLDGMHYSVSTLIYSV
jgi:hypothetical protein